MTSKATILGIDLSTSATGWALFEVYSRDLTDYGVLKANTRGLTKTPKLQSKLIRLERMAEMVNEVVKQQRPDLIVIEEISNSKNRIGQKLLDGQHWVLLQHLYAYLTNDLVYYYDVTGAGGWRTDLKLKQTDADRKNNRAAKKINKKLLPGQKKLQVIGTKHISSRFVNHMFDLNLNVDTNKLDGDIADAVALTFAFLKFRFRKLGRDF